MLEMCNPMDRFLSVVSLLTARIPRIHSWEYVKWKDECVTEFIISDIYKPFEDYDLAEE